MVDLRYWCIKIHGVWVSIPGRLASISTPFSAAYPRALAMASAKLTEPELVGLMLLRSTFPVFVGWGKG